MLFFLRGMEGKPSLWELDSDYSLHVGRNRDDSHASDAWYKKLLSGVDLTKDFFLATHTQLCKAYKGICLLMKLRGCHMKTCLFGIILYVVVYMPFLKLMEGYFVLKKKNLDDSEGLNIEGSYTYWLLVGHCLLIQQVMTMRTNFKM